MSDAPTSSEPTSQPDPNRAGAGAPVPNRPVPDRIGRLLSLVRRLIDYGQTLATLVQHHPSDPRLRNLAGCFGTLDLAVIIARITCGLRRAVLLQARLSRHAASGRDIRIAAVPLPPTAQRKPRAKRQQGDKEPQPVALPLPTPEQIAAEVRRRPIGAVLVDICRDMGVAPECIDRALYLELTEAITLYGGSLAQFFRDITKPLRALAAQSYDAPKPAANGPSAGAPALASGVLTDARMEAQPKLPPELPTGIPPAIPPTITPTHGTGPP